MRYERSYNCQLFSWTAGYRRRSDVHKGPLETRPCQPRPPPVHATENSRLRVSDRARGRRRGSYWTSLISGFITYIYAQHRVLRHKQRCALLGFPCEDTETCVGASRPSLRLTRVSVRVFIKIYMLTTNQHAAAVAPRTGRNAYVLRSTASEHALVVPHLLTRPACGMRQI